MAKARKTEAATEPLIIGQKAMRFIELLLESSTWFGVLTIGATIASSGADSWLQPNNVPPLPVALEGV